MTEQPVLASTTFSYTVTGDLGQEIQDVRQRQAAAEKEVAAAAAAKALVRKMVRSECISQVDTAKALGVCKQRVSQLVH